MLLALSEERCTESRRQPCAKRSPPPLGLSTSAPRAKELNDRVLRSGQYVRASCESPKWASETLEKLLRVNARSRHFASARCGRAWQMSFPGLQLTHAARMV